MLQRLVGPFVRCWLAAATAEMLAANAQGWTRAAQLRVAESAAESLVGGGPPYAVLDEVHLERWVGHVLVRLHDSAAEPRLRTVAPRLDETFARASASLTIDLATAVLERSHGATASRCSTPVSCSPDESGLSAAAGSREPRTAFRATQMSRVGHRNVNKRRLPGAVFAGGRSWRDRC